MLIRFVVDNFFSFGSQKEFNMLPNAKLKTLNHHKYSFDGFELLKMASVYGANGSGKSNLIKSLGALQQIVVHDGVPELLQNKQFKFQKNIPDSKQLLAIEFIQDDTAYYYAIEICKNTITTEELYESGLGKQQDKLVFERKTDFSGKTEITFFKEAEGDEKFQIFKSVLIEDFIKPNNSILKFLSRRENVYLKNVRRAFKWFAQTLEIVTPGSRPVDLINRMDIDSEFRSHTEQIMCAFNIGVTSVYSEKQNLSEFSPSMPEITISNIKKVVNESLTKTANFKTKIGDELIVTKENEDYYVKELKLMHRGKDDILSTFTLGEESDGTIRLLDFIPAFQDVVNNKTVYIIDEIERSIHPLLIKELIRKFSMDNQSTGQLIFTTHESNLLDQDIFRQDEIWFTEKDKNGITDLYSLSDFKEHKTIDIRKGYLNGRYGSIPFLANLQDLNWHTNDIDEKSLC